MVAIVNRLLAGLAVLLLLLLHTYPVFRGASYLTGIGRPRFRLLILTDSHLEGDSKVARMGWRGAVDIWGYDHYLGHIYRTMRFFARPTHTAVLGDLLSSQWIDDAEFRKRAGRMKRILRWDDGESSILAAAGNHDIGYASDITTHRVNRWVDVFGPLNSERQVGSELVGGASPLRLLVINDLMLDGPAFSEDMRGGTHAYLHGVTSKPGTTTILLAHVPMHKEPGVCVDSPSMQYLEQPSIMLSGQNHLSPESSKATLDALFSVSDGVVLTGHDHEGCRVLHFPPIQAQGFWEAVPFSRAAKREAEAGGRKYVEEVTVRSVMGQYGGNTGLLLGDVDAQGRWHFTYKAVPFVHNTVWWVMNIAVAVIVVWLTACTTLGRTAVGRQVAGLFDVSRWRVGGLPNVQHQPRKVRTL